MDYAQYVRATKGNTPVPQSEPVPGKDMHKNNAGAYSFKINKWQQLDRFLILGSVGGTYYASERSLTKTNLESIDECLREDAVRVINRIVELSESGRAPKNDPALLILAKASADANHRAVRQHAMNALPKIARTGTHLFHFVEYAKYFRGWGRNFKRGIANWYNEKSVQKLAYQLAKYKQRDGWSHRDLLRLSHPKANDPARNLLFQKVTHPEIALAPSDNTGTEFYRIADLVSIETDPGKAAELIRSHGVPRECVNTQLLNSRQVWEALLEKMPTTALIRNLGKLSSIGMTERYSEHSKRIVQQLMNSDIIQNARIHPITILGALKVYESGHGVKGALSWVPNREILEALNDAFYLAFKFVEPTQKRYFLALDVSGSMFGSPVNGMPGLDAATAAAAMAMVTLRTESDVILKGFTRSDSLWGSPKSHQDFSGITDLNISKRMLLDQVISTMQGLPFGGTDCALPMLWATKHKQPVDAFIVYTDSETWAGAIHPFEALKRYRDTMGIPAKLIVAGMSATDVSIADPSDAGMLDVAGMDSNVPQIINQFISGDI